MDYTGNVIYHWQLIMINKLISIYKSELYFYRELTVVYRTMNNSQMQ